MLEIARPERHSQHLSALFEKHMLSEKMLYFNMSSYISFDFATIDDSTWNRLQMVSVVDRMIIGYMESFLASVYIFINSLKLNIYIISCIYFYSH